MRFGAHHTNDNLVCNYNIDDKFSNFVFPHKDLCKLVDSRLQFHKHVRLIIKES